MMLDNILDIKCRHGKLQVYAPETDDTFTPIVTPVRGMLRDAKITLSHLFQTIVKH